MGFFSDLREDLSQAVNELMPAEEQIRPGEEQEMAKPVVQAAAKEPKPAATKKAAE